MGGSYNNTSAFSGGSQAFLFSGGSLQNVGVLPGQPASVATAINNLGQIVGYGNTGGAAPHAFLFSGGSMQNLAAGEADAINNLGQVVGEALIGSSAYHAFLYSGGTLQDLNNLIPSNSGWTLTEATGMNDSGQICGYGFNPSGQSRAFLLTRISALDGAVGSQRERELERTGQLDGSQRPRRSRSPGRNYNGFAGLGRPRRNRSGCGPLRHGSEERHGNGDLGRQPQPQRPRLRHHRRCELCDQPVGRRAR